MISSICIDENGAADPSRPPPFSSGSDPGRRLCAGPASAHAAAPEQVDDGEQDDRADEGRHQRPPVEGVAAQMAAAQKTAEQPSAEDRAEATDDDVEEDALLRIGGARGRKLEMKAGDVLILPAGTGHQSLSNSDDLLVVGAYPRKGGYDMCHPRKSDHDPAAIRVAKTPRPRADPVYGADGPLTRLWR